ncbi:hypothetical protein [Jejuia pallidilutea]|nr:hypothetical protein [Jejuia pallidilutea]
MKILLPFILFTFFLSCECKNEPIEPTKIVELNNKEIFALTGTQYIVSEIKGPATNENLTFLKGKDFQFKKSGLIFSNNVEIGKWKNDRWINLDAVELKFLINVVSRNEMKVYSQYFDCKTESIIEESIYLTGNFESESEFSNRIDF